jgi:hypothetical protein
VLTRELRLVLVLFAGLAFIAGILLFVLSAHTDDWFSWTIKPPLTAAFLGASYWAACVLLGWSASRREWRAARPAMLPVLTIAILLLIATLIHVERFHTDTIFGWFWITVYVLVPPLLCIMLWRQLQVAGPPPRDALPLARWLRLALSLEGLVLAGVGIALYVSPASADSLWPWTLTPLTARAVGAFLVGFGAAALQAAWENDLKRLAGSAYAYALLGLLELVAILRYPDELDGSGARGVLYVAFAAIVLATGLVGSFLARMRSVERL